MVIGINAWGPPYLVNVLSPAKVSVSGGGGGGGGMAECSNY